MYEKFTEMLKIINLGEDDELFILGDIVDRGNEPVKILEYIIDKPNIIPLLGNHEVMALDILKRINYERILYLDNTKGLLFSEKQ